MLFFNFLGYSIPVSSPGRLLICVRLWGLGLAILSLAACQRVPPVPDANALQRAEVARPADGLLAQKYERSCQTCHSSRASTAPLTAFASDWQPRLAQGLPTLVAHAREGFKGMPARGYCNDCTDQDFAALITFMSTSPE